MNINIPTDQLLNIKFNWRYKSTLPTDWKPGPWCVAVKQQADPYDLVQHGEMFEIQPTADHRFDKFSSFEDYRGKKLGQELISTLARLRIERNVLRNIYKPLSKARYDRLVRRFTRMERIRVKVQPLQYEEKTIRIKTRSGTKLPETWWSKSAWLWNLLNTKGLAPRKYQKALKAWLYLQQHPEKDVKHYRSRPSYLIDDHTAKTRYKGSVPFVRLVPKTEWKVIPVRDWKKIDDAWARVRSICFRHAQKHEDLVSDLTAKADRLAAELYGAFKLCWSDATTLALPEINGYVPDERVLRDLRSFHVNPDPGAGEGGVRQFFSFVAEDIMTAYSILNTENVVTFGMNLSALCTEDSVLHHSFLPLKGGKGTNPFRLQQYVRDDDGNLVKVYEHDDHWDPYLSTATALLGEASGYYQSRGSKPRLVTLFKDKVEQEDLLFQEKRALAIQRLKNLRVGSRARLVFNPVRSLGEQKDVPLACRTALDFGSWCRAFSSGNQFQAFAIKKAGGSIAYAPIGSAPYAQAEFIRSLRGRDKRAALKRLGWHSIAPVRRKTLAVFAACYLAWKFGIEQTINDARHVLTTPKALSAYVRESLTQLKPILNGHYICPRARYAVTDIRKPLNWAKPCSSVEIKPEEVTWYDEIDFNSVFRDISDGNTSLPSATWIDGVPVVLSKEGLPFACPQLRARSQGPLCLQPELVQDYMYKMLEKHGVKLGPTVYIDRILKGSVYARFSTHNLLKKMLLAKRDWVEYSRPLTTAWELAPLSFIVEWFTNIRSLVDAAQDMFSATSAKLSPVGKPWENLKAEFIAGIDHAHNTELVAELSLQPASCGWWALSDVVENYDSEGKLFARDASHTLVPGRISILWKYRRRGRMTYVEMERTPLGVFARRQVVGGDELPPLNFRLNLNPGKVGTLSLLALHKYL